uniref:transposase n=1 Tax=Cellulosilyticum ruminicola TaxID=425254 RepID=UPI0012ED6129
AKFKEAIDLPITQCNKAQPLLLAGSTIIYDKKVRLGKELTFVTNLMCYSSEEIEWLYKKRWDIELFFKWIKQHCKIKTLMGHSENAVRIQMITGIITYLLLRLTLEKVEKHVTKIQCYKTALFSSS